MALRNNGVFIELAALEMSWKDVRRNLSELIFDTVKNAIDGAGKGLDGIDSVCWPPTIWVTDGHCRDGSSRRQARLFATKSDTATMAQAPSCRGSPAVEAGGASAPSSPHRGVRRTRCRHGLALFVRSDFFSALRPRGIAYFPHARPGVDLPVRNPEHRRGRAEHKHTPRRRPRALHSGGFKSAPSCPLLADDLPLWADAVAAVVISNAPSGVRVAGLGQSSEPYWIGDQRLRKRRPSTRAAARSMKRVPALIGIDIFEVDGLTLYDEAVALEAIGLASHGKGLEVLARDGRCNAVWRQRSRLLRAGDGSYAPRRGNPPAKGQRGRHSAWIGSPSHRNRIVDHIGPDADSRRPGGSMTSVAIVGVGQTNYRRSHPDKSSRELIWEAARKALDDASMEINSIDAIFAGVAPDALAGEASVERSAMMGIGKPFIRVNTGGVTGSSAVFAGATYIKAGRAKAVLVVALERMGQAAPRSKCSIRSLIRCMRRTFHLRRSLWRRCAPRC